MKVLVISDNKENVDFIDSFMTKKGYDVIVYKWIIKAIDNIEEIKPNIIIVSSSEYPRHWKTLGSFVKSGIGGDNIKIYLYEPEVLSPEEQEKAKALGIEGCFSSLDNESFEKYFSDNEANKEKTNSNIIITNPYDGSLLSGKVVLKDKDMIQVKISCDDFISGQQIKEISEWSDGKITFFSANVNENNKEQGILSLAVCEYYEEI